MRKSEVKTENKRGWKALAVAIASTSCKETIRSDTKEHIK